MAEYKPTSSEESLEKNFESSKVEKKSKKGCFWDVFALTFFLAILSAISLPMFVGIKETPDHLLAKQTIVDFIRSCSIKKNNQENELDKISKISESPRHKSFEEFLDNKARSNKYGMYSSERPHPLMIHRIAMKEKISVQEVRQKYNSSHLDWRREYWKIMESLEPTNAEHSKYKRLYRQYNNYRDSLPEKVKNIEIKLASLSAPEISQRINQEAYQFFPKDFDCSGTEDGLIIMSSINKNQLPTFSYNILTNGKYCSHEGPTEEYLGCSNKTNGTW